MFLVTVLYQQMPRFKRSCARYLCTLTTLASGLVIGVSSSACTALGSSGSGPSPSRVKSKISITPGRLQLLCITRIVREKCQKLPTAACSGPPLPVLPNVAALCEKAHCHLLLKGRLLATVCKTRDDKRIRGSIDEDPASKDHGCV